MFRNYVLQNFPFLENDFDALTDYELFCKMMEYVKTLASNDADFNRRLTNLENYISNLDLQDEVNNKLDEMAESGELENLISQYIELATTYVYNSVSDMKSATNLINGSYARTSGFYTYNDGGGAIYKIRTIINTDNTNEKDLIALNDSSLVAELIINNVIDIKQIGAKGDNENDDADYLEYALNNYHNVCISEGTYKINTPIEITQSNITLYGLANSVINITTTPIGLYFNNVANIKINNIKFISNHYGNNLATHKMICINESSNIEFNNNIIYDGAMGLSLYDSENIEIYNNIIHHVSGWGLMLGSDFNNDNNQSSIENANIYNNISFDSGYDGIKLSGYIENINIYNNTCYDNTRDGIDFAGHTAKNVNIHDNKIYNTDENGIDFKQLNRETYPFNDTKTKQFEKINIYNNNINNVDGHGINIQCQYGDVDLKEMIIKNNIINVDVSSSNNCAIRSGILNTTNKNALQIINNEINDAYYGIRITDSKNVDIFNNFITHNRRNSIYVDRITDNFNVQYIDIENNKLYQEEGNIVVNVVNDDLISNVTITNNILYNDGSAYLISTYAFSESTNIVTINYYRDMFSSTPTMRTTKNCIYYSSDASTTQCIGWIGYENNGSPRYKSYIDIAS